VALLPLVRLLFGEPNPQPAKMAMHLLGIMEPVARLPLITATEATRLGLAAELKKLGLLP
jgi:4-hydroxy-tetrahydrodipicolinate synthase